MVSENDLIIVEFHVFSGGQTHASSYRWKRWYVARTMGLLEKFKDLSFTVGDAEITGQDLLDGMRTYPDAKPPCGFIEGNENLIQRLLLAVPVDGEDE